MSINKYNLGKLGENIACDFLIHHNYVILHRNFRTRFGEIDIIAMYNNMIIFIEVKTRSSSNYGIPVESVTYAKLHKIYKTASYYLYCNYAKHVNIRFDAIEVYYNSVNNIKINHIKQII